MPTIRNCTKVTESYCNFTAKTISGQFHILHKHTPRSSYVRQNIVSKKQRSGITWLKYPFSWTLLSWISDHILSNSGGIDLHTFPLPSLSHQPSPTVHTHRPPSALFSSLWVYDQTPQGP